MENIKQYAKRSLAMTMAVIMMISAFPLQSFAEAQTAKPKPPLNYDNADLNHRRRLNDDKLPVLPARPEEGKTSEKFVEDPAQPAIYTLRTDYKAEKGEKYSVNYQPYVASVGAAAKPEEQAKVNKTIDLPNMAGYKKPAGEESFINSYQDIVDAAKFGHQTGDKENGLKYLALREYKYEAKENTIVVKHVFQDMDDFKKFSNPDETITEVEGTQGKIIKKVTKEVNGKQVKEFDYANPETVDLTNPNAKEAFFKHEKLSSLRGNTGSTLEVQALQENERPGFEPQIDKLKTQVPEDTNDFKIEYRYNRAAYNVVFDSQDGTPLPTRTYYFNQEIPKLDTIPSKIGCEFLGWKPSHELEGIDGTKYKKGEIIKDKDGNAIVDLGNTFYKKDGSGKFLVQDGDPVKGTNENEIKLKMPALKLGDGKTIPREKLTFTAVWKDKEKADYAIQFWAEKADHPDNASLLNKYDYMGTRVHQNANTGSTPNLDTESVNGLPFPDLDQARLQKIWNGDKFYQGQYLYLNKFFVYNKNLTDAQNKDSNTNVTKTVSPTGKTVYNIYYDRQVYDLYFTKSNVSGSGFYPEIWKNDKKVGEEGNPYHFKARFNQSMVGLWPDDVKEVRGFTEGNNSLGWLPNLKNPKHFYRDTPPYRLSANLFIDFPELKDQGGYASEINLGNGGKKPASITDLSFGIDQSDQTMPHHIDFWLDGFDGNQVIDYDLYTIKSDVNNSNYHDFLPPDLQGFTPKNSGGRGSEFKEDSDLDDLNDEREEITPFPEVYYKELDENDEPKQKGKLYFMKNFPGDDREFNENGYLKFEYSRNKYPLRFNTDPAKIKVDSEFKYPVEGGTLDQNKNANALETFYGFPLKCLSPDVDKDDEYKKVDTEKGPENLLDNPNNLYALGLYDLLQRDKNDPSKFAKDAKGNYRIKRPEGLSDQDVFKGWAMDPEGNKLVWENKDEKMPSHPVNLYATWGEADYKWKVTVDPNGGKMDPIGLDALTTEKKTIKEKEGDNEEAKSKTYPVKGYKAETAEAGKQVFTVVQRQKLKKLPKPERYGYDFLGWEVIRYKKDAKTGDYTDEIDDSYRKTYKVPELYSFGNDVVSPIYLKAIWVENKRANVKVLHYYLKNNSDGKLVLDTTKYPNPEPNDLAFKRVGDYVPATGEKQDERWILADNDELMKKLDGKWVEQIKDETGKVTGKEEHDLKPEYEAYNNRVKLNNTYFQSFRVQDNINVGTKENPIYKPNPENIFRFYYRPFRTRNYKVNYIDERGKKAVEDFFKGLDLTDTAGLTGDALLKANKANKAKFKANKDKLEKILDDYKVINKEKVTSQCRHYDARNYRHIPGWKLASGPQQQLFYDVNEGTNEFLGINGTGSNEIYFYYTDARVIEVKNPEDPVPDGYVRVTFKIDDTHKGGVFKDKDGKEVTELHYDVIKGLKSDNLPHPIIWEGGNDAQGNEKKKEANRYYITPDQGKSFKGWDNDKWLNAQTEINRNYTFTAYFDWSGLTSSGLVRTEAFKGVDGKWVNDFAPKLEDLKKQLVWKEKDKVTKIPEGTDIKFIYKNDAGKGTEVKTDEDLFNLVKEMKAEDKDQTVRTVNIVAKVTFKDGKQTQELPIPITVYKNRYEALNEKGDKPIYLTEAEGKEAKDGGLKDVTGNYVMVTVTPTGDMKAKDNKVYYVNPKAWVEIPEVKADGSSTFINWTADQVNQNDDGKEKGKFDFAKRHKFTENTVITPVGAGDVVEQEKGKDKPDVPKTYVKVIVKTTDKATTETAFERTFWVNPTKDVTIGVTNPTGKTVAPDATKPGTVGYKMTFFKWETEDKSKAWESKIAGKFEKDTTIVAKYSVEFEKIKDLTPKTDTVPTPQGKIPKVEEITKKITPPEGKKISKVTVVKNPDVNKPGDSKVQVIVKYDDGSSVGTNDKPLEIPVKVHEPIVKANPDGSKPKDALENYVKVTFTAGEGGSVSGNLVYYVSPEVEVDMATIAEAITKTANTGYINGTWDTSEAKKLKDTFKTDTEFTFNFTKTNSIIEGKEGVQKPDGYVTVKFTAGDNGKIIDGNKIYYVNPKANVKIVKQATAGTNDQLPEPATEPNQGYAFTKWEEPIDYTNPIDGDREYVAQFSTNQATLTYDAGGAKGTAPAAQTAAKGGNVTLSTPDKLTQANHIFIGWKIGNELHKAGKAITLSENKTAVAQWTKGVEKLTQDELDDPEHFIKVTFKQGDHGQLIPDQKQQPEKTVTYKIAKGYDIDQAKQAGLVIPAIQPAKYYKAKDANGGWDKELKLEGKEATFTAQYELESNVIPVDPTKDNDTLKREKPEGMVLVDFKVNPKKAFMTGNTKFYVKKSELVNIEAPVVHPLTLENGQVNDYEFKGWKLKTGGTEKVSFNDDTTIDDTPAIKPDIRIRNPRPNAKIIFIQALTTGATGHLEVTRGNKTTKITSSPRGMRNIFDLKTLGGVNKNDLIKFYAEKDGIKSVVREYRVK